MKDRSLWFRNLCISYFCLHTYGSIVVAPTSFNVGVILDLESWDGIMSRQCISMAVEDFYVAHKNYRTRLVLHTRDAKDVGSAVLKVVEMLKETKVQAILGPQRSAQAKVVAEIGNKAHVPVLSFTTTNPYLYNIQLPYFINVAHNDVLQFQVIAAIIKYFRWKEVVFIYEETDNDHSIIPDLIDAFQTIDVRVIHRISIHHNATDDQVIEEVYRLGAMPIRVFIVHTQMSTTLGPRIIQQAKEVGLMTEGSAWLITEGLTNLLDVMDYSDLDAMEGVLGIKRYIPRSKQLYNFTVRMRIKNPQGTATLGDLNMFCLNAYDSIWALALAAERTNDNYKELTYKHGTNHSELPVSAVGSQYLDEILKSDFDGLSGQIRFADRQVQSAPLYKIVNVFVYSGRVVAFWNVSIGISQRPDVKTSKKIRPVVWPGERKQLPLGWVIPYSPKERKTGHRVNDSFTDYHKTESTNDTKVSGYSMDVFKAVMDAFPYGVQYEFVPFNLLHSVNGNLYNELFHQNFLQQYDAVVGDITVASNRSVHADFSLPYATGGLGMVVRVEYSMNMWIILRLFIWKVWLTYCAVFTITIFVILYFEHRQILRASYFESILKILALMWKVLLSPYCQIEGMKKESTSVLQTFFRATIFLSGVSASILLTTMLDNYNGLLTIGDYVVRNEDIVKTVLMQLNVSESQLKAYNSLEEYEEALRKGSKDGVAAVFREVPYIKLLLNKSRRKYRMVGPVYQIEGIGYVFPEGSPLAFGELQKIENRWLGRETKYSYPSKGISMPSIVNAESITTFLLFLLADMARDSESILLRMLRYIFCSKRRGRSSKKFTTTSRRRRKPSQKK